MCRARVVACLRSWREGRNDFLVSVSSSRCPSRGSQSTVSVYRAGTRGRSIYILSTYQSSFRQVFFFLEGSEVCLSLYISISYKLVNKREERQLRYCSQGSQRDGPSCHGGASPAWSPSRSSRIIMWRMRHGRSFCGA